MTDSDNTNLEKNLGLLDVFSIAAGAMISSGLFVLPALAFQQTGPSMVISYVLALPSLLSKAELATAMPRSGGTYFYVKRSMGGLWGLFCGLADWFSLSMKCAFAIFGIALFARFGVETLLGGQLNDFLMKSIAAGCCVLFGALNLVSVKETTKFQNRLVAFLLLTLGLFTVFGLPNVSLERYSPFMTDGVLKMLATTGMVFVSYGGLTHVASIAEEIKDPGRNIPLGMVLAWLLVSIFYGVIVFIVVGVLDQDTLLASEAPVSMAAGVFLGKFGFILLSCAALAAFVTTANGGIFAASRSPLAMSRDHLMPERLSHISKRFGTPHLSIMLTCGFMIFAVVFLELEMLVKTASTMMILLFILDNASVIFMRESKILSYRPRFRAPLYPYLQAVTIVIYVLLLIDMGMVPLLICAAFFLFSIVWYRFFVAPHLRSDSAMTHLVERVTDKQIKTPTLENELRDILIERDEIIADRFDQLIQQCEIMDLKGPQKAEEVFRQVADALSKRLEIDTDTIYDRFMQREAEGSTVLEPGLAIPHIVIDGQSHFDILLVRACDGITFPHAPDPVETIFFLAGTKDERNFHLRALMAIAQIAQQKDFYPHWFAARDIESLRNLILLSKRKREKA
ncbi:MAG: amino acid permease [Planctomycetota bacterium]|jgi:amino acid transporter/mannitol/fructose-specific phosphotransferase system IIA component (Ntr-type)